jgi:hypothetical protein
VLAVINMGKQSKNKNKTHSKAKNNPPKLFGTMVNPEQMNFVDMLHAFSRLPNCITFPPFDVLSVLQKFAFSNQLGLVDITEDLKALLPGCNKDAAVTLSFFFHSSQRAIKDDKNLYFLLADPHIVEACVFLCNYFQIETRGQCVGGRMLQLLVFNEKEYLFASNLENERQLKNCLNSITSNWECVLCLRETNEVHTAVPAWQCFHSICGTCLISEDFKKMSLKKEACPMCKSPLIPWSNYTPTTHSGGV